MSAPKGKATLCQAGCARRTRNAEPAVESQRTDELNRRSAAPAAHFAAYKHRRSTYEAYGGDEKLAQLVREIGWSHNISILEKCKSEQEREFYIRSCRKHGWSRSVLVHQIENQAFQRTMSSQTNFGAALDPAVSVHAQLAVKDEYTFAFLGTRDPVLFCDTVLRESGRK